MAAAPPNSGDFSPSATVIPFSPPLPLLRVPINSPPSDTPSLPPFLLSFKNPKSFSTAFNSCQTQITQQCESGARIGCSISASSKCKPPWWKLLLGMEKEDFGERAKCEEREMEGCLVVAREKCVEFAKEKCFLGFGEARVEVDGFVNELVDWREVGRFIGLVCRDGKMGGELIQAEKIVVRLKNRLRVGSSCKGKDLLDSEFCTRSL